MVKKDSSDDPRPEGTPEEIGRWVLHQKFHERDPAIVAAYKTMEVRKERLKRNLRDLPDDISPHNLRKARWGIVVPEYRLDEVRRDLKELIRQRHLQMGEKPPIFPVTRIRKTPESRMLSAEEFLRSRGETLGTIDPKRLPYYLLLVASPDELPFEFQYRLSLGRSVGRLCFQDSMGRHDSKGYRAYARAVVAAETDGVDLPRRTEFFSVENDKTLEFFGEQLVAPIVLGLDDRTSEWTHGLRRDDVATKDTLRALLGGDDTPALLMVSSHGRRKSMRDGEEQVRLQGAPVCYGDLTEADDPNYEDRLFTATDFGPETDLHGLVTFFFQCYGAGTPDLNDFPHMMDGLPAEAALETKPLLMAKRPFLASLPVEMLRRGALAVVGHVDRGWTTTFSWPDTPNSINTVDTVLDALVMLLNGHRIGHAMRPLNRRYGQIAARLGRLQDRRRQNMDYDLQELGILWVALHDARNLILLGDPAVYLRGRKPLETTVTLTTDLIETIHRYLRPGESADNFLIKFLRSRLL